MTGPSFLALIQGSCLDRRVHLGAHRCSSPPPSNHSDVHFTPINPVICTRLNTASPKSLLSVPEPASSGENGLIEGGGQRKDSLIPQENQGIRLAVLRKPHSTPTFPSLPPFRAGRGCCTELYLQNWKQGGRAG